MSPSTIERPCGRPRSEAARQAVLEVAARWLTEGGRGAFTIEGVVAHSVDARITIYKWSASKGALALNGFFASPEPRIAFGDSGEIHVDLRAEVDALIRLLAVTLAGNIIAGLVGEAQTDATRTLLPALATVGGRRAAAGAVMG